MEFENGTTKDKSINFNIKKLENLRQELEEKI